MRYITNLTVLEGENAQPPSGWKKIDKDLNKGAGGAYLYFAYEEGDGPDRAITDIMFILGRDEPVPERYHKIDVDLNKGAKGKYIYAAFTRDRQEGSPITGLDVLISDSSSEHPERPWIRIDQDLNEGAKGKYVYLVYKTV
jgi:hypothetical protein